MTARFRWQDAALGGIGILGLWLIWEFAVRTGLVSPLMMPSPTIAIASAFDRLTVAQVSQHVLTSLMRVVLGFTIGGVAGVILGIGLGWYRWLDGTLRPIIDMLRPIPPLAWIPIAIIWFGLGEPSKIFVIFLGGFFPVFTNAYLGMVGCDPLLLRAAQTMGLRGPRLLFQVAIPAALPDIATGVRVGWGLSFGVLVAAELIAAKSGLGFMIMQARHLGEIGVVITGIILIGTTNLATDYMIGEVIRRRIGRWHAV